MICSSTRQLLHGKESFEASRRTYGSPRLTVVLRRAGETCGRHRVARPMRTHRLRATQKRRFRPQTTDSRHLCPIAPNLERAVQAQRPCPGLLHHSDRGSPYAGDAYRELLRSHGVIPSMSRAGNCYDNARMESFWATLKSELIQDRVFVSRRSEKRNLLVHRGLLQPHAAPRRAGLHFPRGL